MPLTPLESKLLILAEQRLITLMCWLREYEPPVTPRAAVSILDDAIRLHRIVRGECNDADVAWLLGLRFEKGARVDPETKRETWSRCQKCGGAV